MKQITSRLLRQPFVSVWFFPPVTTGGLAEKILMDTCCADHDGHRQKTWNILDLKYRFHLFGPSQGKLHALGDSSSLLSLISNSEDPKRKHVSMESLTRHNNVD